MSETTAEEQAAMAIKLADNVRDLIRSEVKAALEDPVFLGSMLSYAMVDHLSSQMYRSISSRGFIRIEVLDLIKEEKRAGQEEESRRQYLANKISGLTY